jgi:hypothetical protein
MIRLLPCALALLTACGAGGASPVARSASARAALDRVLAEGRRAHLTTDPALLASSLADTLVSLDAGAVSLQPRDSVRAMFERYFAGARYYAWDDLEPPRIDLSDDASLAWVARVVCVDREEPDARGGRQRRRFVSAYAATYAWRDGGWRMTTVASTFTPTPPERCPSADR